MLYDITRTVASDTAVWPGHTPFSYRQTLDIRAGDAVNLTAITMSAHTGSHADAHYHYEADGAHPAQMALDAYIGQATVVTTTKYNEALTSADFPTLQRVESVERVLIRSHVSDRPDTTFPTEYPHLSVELVEWLAEKGLRLVGLDSPSVDPFESLELPCHHALGKRGIVILELLQLSHVPDGTYELIAPPLKLDGVCGSPVRAILRA